MTTRYLKFGVPAFLLLAASVGWMAARTRATEETEPAGGPMPVETIAVEQVRSYTVRRSYTGTVEARRATELSFQRTGQIVSISVEHGERVTEGQALAQLDTRRLNARRRQVAAERAQAAAMLAELEAGVRAETIAAARAEVRSLQAQLDLARLTAKRQGDLRSQNATSQQQHDQAVYEWQAAQGRLEAAQKRLEEYEAGSRTERIEAQRAVVAGYEASLADLDCELEDSTLAAPFSGTIAERYVDEGAVVSPGTVVLRLVEDHRLEAWIGVPSAMADRLETGQEHRLLVEGEGYAGVVSAVLPELDSTTRTRRAVFGFEADTSGRVVPGQLVRLELTEEVAERGYWLPAAALVRGSRGLWTCFAVVPDGDQTGVERLQTRDLEILHTEGERVFVRGTLRPGDEIVAGGTHRVVSGQIVRRIGPDRELSGESLPGGESTSLL